MAIKTKKISDLTSLIVGDDCHFLGTKNDVTGKISYESIKEDIKPLIVSVIKEEKEKEDAEQVPSEVITPVTPEDVTSIQTKVETLKGEVSDLTASHNTLSKNHTALSKKHDSDISVVTKKHEELSKKHDADTASFTQYKASNDSRVKALEDRVTAKVAELEGKIAELVAFDDKVKQFFADLQANSYLTLAEVKKAANTAYPVETPTPEEE